MEQPGNRFCGNVCTEDSAARYALQNPLPKRTDDLLRTRLSSEVQIQTVSTCVMTYVIMTQIGSEKVLVQIDKSKCDYNVQIVFCVSEC
jgi:hypothetical protein